MNIPTLSTLDKGKLAGAEAANHFASTLRSGWVAFWQRPTATVLSDLNADLAGIAETFALNTQAGTAINALLDAVDDGRFPARAPVTLPDYYSFNGSAWIFTPPPPPEPEPIPE